MNIQNLIGLTTGTQSSALLQNRPAAESTETQTDTETTTTPPADTSASPNATSSNAAEEFETFLTLLTAQIRNQDPLAPLDSTQFVEQLATFSGLELQAESNQKLDQITALLTQQNTEG